MQWSDPAWSRDNWILFVVLQNVNGCLKVRTDKIRPDGSTRTQVTDSGPNCTPAGSEPSGDADPGLERGFQDHLWFKGFPVPPAGGPAVTQRKLYASDPCIPESRNGPEPAFRTELR
jgi:hypothetical protein